MNLWGMITIGSVIQCTEGQKLLHFNSGGRSRKVIHLNDYLRRHSTRVKVQIGQAQFPRSNLPDPIYQKGAIKLYRCICRKPI